MEIRVGDFGFEITFTVVDENGVVVDLTGAEEIRFLVAQQDTMRTIVNGVCEVVEATAGKCKYVVKSEDFKKAGNYIGGVKVKYDDTRVVTTKDVMITVKPTLGSF